MASEAQGGNCPTLLWAAAALGATIVGRSKAIRELGQGRVRLDFRKRFFPQRVAGH